MSTLEALKNKTAIWYLYWYTFKILQILANTDIPIFKGQGRMRK